MDNVVILGAAESGFGSAVLAKEKGLNVFVSDGGAIKECYLSEFIRRDIPFEQNGHSLDKILEADVVIKSPGIPDKADVVKAIKKAGISIISEIEFAGRYTSAKTICITGSNGKTTVTTLVYELLKKAGYNVGIAGNIGKSFAYQVATEQFDWYVLEISSFQLDGMYSFKADIAILTNITPDHLDRYEYKIENYIKSKFRIIQNQTKDDFFIYSGDNAVTIDYMKSHIECFNMRCMPFTVKDKLLEGAYINDNGLIDIDFMDAEFLYEITDLKIKGIHNIYNIMAATLAALAAGVTKDVVKEVLGYFSGVEHRLESVYTKKGIEYINDSKATNVDSVWYALESMDKPVVWIAGGQDKGNDYAQLNELVKNRVKVLICMGIDNDKLVEYFTGTVPFIYSTSSMEEAIEKANIVAKKGDVVLLSPACASFDLFENYEDRGRKFKECVLNIE